ncbi:MAG: helix-turn-helix transcriptional regulator [Clostridia bacterium]|nr:helix-turn-helix transcriptional regulator [Clostridia bacterium]
MALDYKLIGSRLKQARLKKKYTQEKLAEELDVSIAFLSRVECGSLDISLKRLSQICELLGTTEGEILNGTSTTSRNYLNEDLFSLLKNCPPEKSKLIYELAKVVAEN